MNDYLKKYLNKDSEENVRKKKKKNVKIYDSEDETNKKASNKKKDIEDTMKEYDFIESDESDDIPITITEAETARVIEISNENKKKILESLNNNGCLLSKKKEFAEESKIQSREMNESHRVDDNHVVNNKKGKKKSKNHSDNSYRCEKFSEKSNLDDTHDSIYSCDTDSDLSLPRRTRNEYRSSSSSEKHSENESSGKEKRRKRKRTNHIRKPDRMDNTTSSRGTSSSRVSETNFIYYADQKDTDKIEQMSKIVYRDAKGKIISREEWIKEQKEKIQRKNKKKKAPEHIELEWASGLVQKEMRENILKENERIIKYRDIVNYDIDSDYDNELKNRERDEDPMNIYLKKEKKETDKNEKPTCPFQSPYNRFNIPAGYRWDGVIRGNGYEEKRYQALKLKQQQNKTSFMNSSYGI